MRSGAERAVRASSYNHGSFGGTPFTSFDSNTSEPEAEMIRVGADVVLKGSRERFLEHYHQCSYAETAYSTAKGKLGYGFRSKSNVGQINESLCKVL